MNNSIVEVTRYQSIQDILRNISWRNIYADALIK